MAQSRAYFQKFPYLQYDGKVGINLLKRVNLNSNVKNFYTGFYPYTLQKGEKIEHVSFNYYGDVEYDWIIYHANDTIDPFFDVNLSDSDFDKFILKKYGNTNQALRKVKEYRSNWSSDDTIISPSAYEVLPSSRKKYWQPIQSALGVVSYERSNTNFTASTNKIESFDLINSSGTFTVGENVSIVSNTSYASVTWANTTSCVIQHVIGKFSANTNYAIVGEESGVTATVNAATHSVLTNVIPEDEQVYYSPLTFYDYEFELNELKREIYLIRDQYVETLHEQLAELLE